MDSGWSLKSPWNPGCSNNPESPELPPRTDIFGCSEYDLELEGSCWRILPRPPAAHQDAKVTHAKVTQRVRST